MVGFTFSGLCPLDVDDDDELDEAAMEAAAAAAAAAAADRSYADK